MAAMRPLVLARRAAEEKEMSDACCRGTEDW
jgi:hypothetical protein